MFSDAIKQKRVEKIKKDFGVLCLFYSVGAIVHEWPSKRNFAYK